MSSYVNIRILVWGSWFLFCNIISVFTVYLWRQTIKRKSYLQKKIPASNTNTTKYKIIFISEIVVKKQRSKEIKVFLFWKKVFLTFKEAILGRRHHLLRNLNKEKCSWHKNCIFFLRNLGNLGSFAIAYLSSLRPSLGNRAR